MFSLFCYDCRCLTFCVYLLYIDKLCVATKETVCVNRISTNCQHFSVIAGTCTIIVMETLQLENNRLRSELRVRQSTYQDLKKEKDRLIEENQIAMEEIE